MKNWYKKITAQEEIGQICPSCNGKGSIRVSPNDRRMIKCYNCLGTGYEPEFSEGDEVYINSREYGAMEGIISELREFYDGEWIYDVLVDDEMDKYTIRESELEKA